MAAFKSRVGIHDAEKSLPPGLCFRTDAFALLVKQHSLLTVQDAMISISNATPKAHSAANILHRAILIRVPDEAMGHTTSMSVGKVRTAK